MSRDTEPAPAEKPRSRTVLAAQAFDRIRRINVDCENAVAESPVKIRERFQAKIEKVKEALDSETLAHLERLLAE